MKDNLRQWDPRTDVLRSRLYPLVKQRTFGLTPLGYFIGKLTLRQNDLIIYIFEEIKLILFKKVNFIRRACIRIYINAINISNCHAANLSSWPLQVSQKYCNSVTVFKFFKSLVNCIDPYVVLLCIYIYLSSYRNIYIERGVEKQRYSHGDSFFGWI